MVSSLPYPSTSSLLDIPLANSPDNSIAPQDQLIKQAQNGNLQAFNELVLTYLDRVFRQALWMLNDEAAAEDAFQEIFLRVYQKISTFYGGPFRAWLLRIAHNFCLDQIYAARRHPCQPLLTITVDGEEVERYWAENLGGPSETILERKQTGYVIAQSFYFV